MKKFLTATALAGLAAVAVTVAAADPFSSVSAADDYLETFESPDSMNTFDFYVTNGRDFFNRPTSWQGDHAAGSPCGNPSTTRTVRWNDDGGSATPTRTTNPGDTAYWCAPGGRGTEHMMTSFKTGGYAHVDFTPKRSFDDVARVCWDQNITNLGNRKWTQVAIAPISVARSVAPRLDWTHPGFREGGGPASWGLGLNGGVFLFSTTLGNAETFTGGGGTGVSNSGDANVSDKAKRTTTCLTDLENGTIRVEQERYSGSVERSTLPGSFPNGEVKVVFQDVSYNPDKAETEPLVSDPYTWHWDNLLVSSDPGTPLPSTSGSNNPATPPPPPVPTADPSIAGQFDSMTPARLVDTRTPRSTVDWDYAGTGKRSSGSTMRVRVAGRGGVAENAAAVSLNVTSVEPDGPGFVTVFPCGERPDASSLNLNVGHNVPNAVMTKLNGNGDVCIYTQTSTHLVVDVNGSIPTRSDLTTITPRRYLDTRADGATWDGESRGEGAVRASGTTKVRIAGRGSVPANAKTVSINLTAVNAKTRGFATVVDCAATGAPTTSNINFEVAQPKANAVIAPIGSDGSICLFSHSTTDLIVDVNGYIDSDDGFTSFTSDRFMDTRAANLTFDNTYDGQGRRPAGQVTEIQVEGRGNVTSAAGAVAVQLTITSSSGDGFATIYPCGENIPNASNVNYLSGEISSNAAMTRIGQDGKVCVYTHTTAHVIVDVAGWFPE
jgi:hypothetical protein